MKSPGTDWRRRGGAFSFWLKYRLGAWLASLAWRALACTLRKDRVGFESVKALADADKRFILAFWHRRLVMMPLSYPFKKRRVDGEKRGVAVLSSDSKDGEYSAAILRPLGIESVRGTASHGAGAQGLVRMIQAVRQGWDLGITPDGPRGPRFQAKPGAVAIARKSRAWIVPVAVAYSNAWQLRSWDGMLIPKPFSRVTVIYAEPYQVPEGLEDEGPHARVLEDALMSLENAADGFFK